jgi:DDE_Tnp_1-associated
VSFWHSACGPLSPDPCISVDRAAEDADISGLLGLLASIPDPRSRRGKQYSLEFALAVCVVAMLAGAKNYTEIARHAADMPPVAAEETRREMELVPVPLSVAR